MKYALQSRVHACLTSLPEHKDVRIQMEERKIMYDLSLRMEKEKLCNWDVSSAWRYRQRTKIVDDVSLLGFRNSIS